MGAEEIFFNSYDVTDGAIMYPLYRFNVAGVITTVQAGDEAQVFLDCQFGRSLHQLYPGRIDTVRLFNEDVLAHA